MSRDTGLDVTMLQAQAAVQSRAIDALPADVVAAMLVAATVLEENARDYNQRGHPGAGMECEKSAARLRALAGDAHA